VEANLDWNSYYPGRSDGFESRLEQLLSWQKSWVRISAGTATILAEVVGSNPNRNTYQPDRCFVNFQILSGQMAGGTAQIRYDRFLANPFQFTGYVISTPKAGS
jgi:hypothetical protein